MQKPNLNKIIADNLDKAKFQSKKQFSLPGKYNTGGTYISDRAQATQFGEYRMGGGMFPEYHSYAPPRLKEGGGPGPKKPFFPVSNFTEPRYVAGQNPEGRYGYSDNTIWYDPNSQIENVNNPWWLGHEQYHHYQKLSGKDKQGQRDAELDAKVDDMIKANPELQFVPRSKLIEGSKSFPGAEVRMYEDPNTVEGGARAYEQYIENGGKSIFPKGNNNSRNNYPTESAPLRKGVDFKNGGGLLSRTVTCSSCGHSWKGVDGGMDPTTCHKCGGQIKMQQGGDIPRFDEGGSGPCQPGFYKNAEGKCVKMYTPSSFTMPTNVASSTGVAKTFVSPLVDLKTDTPDDSYQSEIADSNNFLTSWYRGRVRDPRYGNVAQRRIAEVPKINIKEVSQEHLDKQNANAYYMPGTRNIYLNPENSYSRKAATQVHEKTHELYDLFPQNNQDRIIQSLIVPKEKWHNNSQGYDLDYNYVSDPTEVAARLNVFRRRFGLNPRKKYTSKEMQTIINNFNSMQEGEYEQGQSGEHNIRQLLDIIGNDPEKLARMNDEIVMNQKSVGTNVAKYGGDISVTDLNNPLIQYYNKLMNKYGPGGETTDGCPAGYSKHPLTKECMPNGYAVSQVIANTQRKTKSLPFQSIPANTTDVIGKTPLQIIKDNQTGQEINDRNIATSKRTFVGPAPFQTIDDKRKSLEKKKQLVQNNPNIRLDENNDIVLVNPDRGFQGQPLTPNAKRWDKGMSHIMNAIETAGALTGVGQISSNLLRLGASGLEREFGRNFVSRNLKNFTSKINPTLNAIDEAAAYVQMDPIGIMGNRLNSQFYNPTTALNTANNTVTGVKNNLTNSAIEGTDLILGDNNLRNLTTSSNLDISPGGFNAGSNSKSYVWRNQFDEEGNPTKKLLAWNRDKNMSMQDEYIENLKNYYNSPAFKQKMQEFYPDVDVDMYVKKTLQNLEEPMYYSTKPGTINAGGYYRTKRASDAMYIPGHTPTFKQKVANANTKLDWKSMSSSDEAGTSLIQNMSSGPHELRHQTTNANELLPEWLTKKQLQDDIREDLSADELLKLNQGQYNFNNYYTNPTEFDVRIRQLKEDLKNQGIIDYHQSNDFTEDQIRQLQQLETSPQSFKEFNDAHRRWKNGEISSEEYNAAKFKFENTENPTVLSQESKDLFKYWDPKYLAQMMKLLPAVAPAVIGVEALKKKKTGGSVLENYYNSRLYRADDGVEVKEETPIKPGTLKAVIREMMAAEQTPEQPVAQDKPIGPENQYMGTSIVDYLATKGYPGTKTFRKQLAKQYGVENYDFSGSKNIELLNKLRQNDDMLEENQPAFTPVSVENMMQMEKEVAVPKESNVSSTVNKSLKPKKADLNALNARLKLASMNFNPVATPNNQFLKSRMKWTPSVTKKKPVTQVVDTKEVEEVEEVATPVNTSPFGGFANPAGKGKVLASFKTPSPYMVEQPSKTGAQSFNQAAWNANPINPNTFFSAFKDYENEIAAEETDPIKKKQEPISTDIEMKDILGYFSGDPTLVLKVSNKAINLGNKIYNSETFQDAKSIFEERGISGLWDAYQTKKTRDKGLKKGDDSKTITNFTIPVINTNAQDSLPPPVVFGKQVADTDREDPNFYHAPMYIDLNRAKFGFKNRGGKPSTEQNGITETAGLVLTPFANEYSLKSKTRNSASDDFLGTTSIRKYKDDEIKDEVIYGGIDDDGNFQLGYGKDMKGKNLTMSDFRSVETEGFIKDAKGNYKLGTETGNKKTSKVPHIKTDKGETHLPFLVPNKGKDQHKTYGQNTGGKIVIATPDFKEKILIGGSLEDVDKALEEFKAKYKLTKVRLIVLDNGTYSRGFMKKGNKISSKDWEKYEVNSSGGAGFYLKGQGYKMGGSVTIGDEMDVTDEELEELRKQGYKFDII